MFDSEIHRLIWLSHVNEHNSEPIPHPKYKDLHLESLWWNQGPFSYLHPQQSQSESAPPIAQRSEKWDANLSSLFCCVDANATCYFMWSKSAPTSSCLIGAPYKHWIYELHIKPHDLWGFLCSGLLLCPRDRICIHRHFLRFLCTT